MSVTELPNGPASHNHTRTTPLLLSSANHAYGETACCGRIWIGVKGSLFLRLRANESQFMCEGFSSFFLLQVLGSFFFSIESGKFGYHGEGVGGCRDLCVLYVLFFPFFPLSTRGYECLSGDKRNGI